MVPSGTVFPEAAVLFHHVLDFEHGRQNRAETLMRVTPTPGSDGARYPSNLFQNLFRADALWHVHG